MKRSVSFMLIFLIVLPAFAVFTPKAIAAENVIFQDDFESYTVGTFPSLGGWELVFNGMGNQYQVITDAYSASPSKSLQLWGNPNDWSALAQKQFSSTSSYLGYEVSILISAVGTGGPGRSDAVGFYNKGASTWGNFYALLNFNHDTMNILAEDQSVLGTWTTGTWYNIRTILDRTTNTYAVWINGQSKGTGFRTVHTDTNIINAMSLTSDHPGVKDYFDDVKVFEVSGTPPPTNAPVISSVSTITATQLQAIDIKGSGFGNTWPQTTPVGDGSVDTVEGSARASSTTPWMTIGDTGKYQKTGDTSDGGENWAAGTTDFSTVFCEVGIYITSWTDTEIILGGFGTHLGTNGQGTWYIEPGDPLTVDVFTPSGQATYHINVAGAPSPTQSSTSVVCSPNPVSVGSPVTCTATVSGSNPTGTVTWSTSSSTTGSFSAPTGTLSSGSCSTTYTDTSPGTVTITASYSGDSNNAASSNSTTLIVRAIDWWPTFQHDSSRSGYSTSSAPNTAALIWQADYNKIFYGSLSGAITCNGVVFATDTTFVVTLNETDGSLLWRHDMTGYGAICSTPSTDGTLIYVVSQGEKGGSGSLHALSCSDGHEVWGQIIGGWNGYWYSPAISQSHGLVVVGSQGAESGSLGAAHVWAFNKNTGGLVWQYDVPYGEFYTSAAIDETSGKIFIVNYDSNPVAALYSIDLVSGNYLNAYYFTYTGHTGTPTVYNGKVYVWSGSSPYYLYCFDENLAFKWKTRLNGGFSNLGGLAAAYGRIFTGGDCVDASSGSILWDNAGSSGVYTTTASPSVADGKMYWEDNNGFSCYNATTGAFIWGYTAGPDYYGTPAISDGKVVFTTDRQAGLYVFGTYDVTIAAHCNAEGKDVSITATMDGSSSQNTPYTFTGLTGAHNFTVPSTDLNGDTFLQWSTGQTTTTITVSAPGTYTAYYAGYSVTINAHDDTEGVNVNVAIDEDHSPTGLMTTHTFSGLTGTHIFSVASTDPDNHSFKRWSNGVIENGISVSTPGGTYTAYYSAVPARIEYVQMDELNGFMMLTWSNPLLGSYPDTSVTSFKIYKGVNSKNPTYLTRVDWSQLYYNDYHVSGTINSFNTYYYWVTGVNSYGEGPMPVSGSRIYNGISEGSFCPITVYSNPPHGGCLQWDSGRMFRSGQTVGAYNGGGTPMPFNMMFQTACPGYNFAHSSWQATGAISIDGTTTPNTCYITALTGSATLTGTFALAVPPPNYDVTISAHDNTNGKDVSVLITMDGASTGCSTPHVFSGLSGSHNFTVPSTDPSGNQFKEWNAGAGRTITVSTGDVYVAYYEALPSVETTWNPSRDSYWQVNDYTLWSPGNCYGLSSTEILYFRHYVLGDPSYPYFPAQNPPAAWTSDLNLPRPVVLNNVSFAVMFHQVFDPNVRAPTPSPEDVEFDKLFAAMEVGTPEILAMHGHNSTGGVAYHAIVAYGLDWLPDGTINIRVSDPNVPQKEEIANYDPSTQTFSYNTSYGWSFDWFIAVMPGMIETSWIEPYVIGNPDWWARWTANWLGIYVGKYWLVCASKMVTISENGQTDYFTVAGNSQTFVAGIGDSCGIEEGNVQAYALPWSSTTFPFSISDPGSNNSTILIARVDNESGQAVVYGYLLNASATQGSLNFTAAPSSSSLLIRVGTNALNVRVTFFYATSQDHSVFQTPDILVGPMQTLSFTVTNWQVLNSTSPPPVTWTVTAGAPSPVGGEWVPIDKLQLLAPWINVVLTMAIAASFVSFRRIKKRKD